MSVIELLQGNEACGLFKAYTTKTAANIDITMLTPRKTFLFIVRIPLVFFIHIIIVTIYNMLSFYQFNYYTQKGKN